MIPTDYPIKFAHLSFPVRPAYAMTLNKSQGQTFKVCGMNLTQPPFSHGQFYVGCSRVGDADNLHIYSPTGKTENIVYDEVIAALGDMQSLHSDHMN